MPQAKLKISSKTIGFIAALVVPMLLIPSAGNARSANSDWSFLNQPIKVKQNYTGSHRGQGSDRKSLRSFFDQPAPEQNRAMNKARNKRANRSRHANSKRSRRHGYTSNYYDNDYATSCVSPRIIHRQLKRQGWRNFHNLRIRRNVLAFKARQARQKNRGNHLIYNLRIDRCSGALIKAKLQMKDMWYIRWMRRISSLY